MYKRERGEREEKKWGRALSLSSFIKISNVIFRLYSYIFLPLFSLSNGPSEEREREFCFVAI